MYCLASSDNLVGAWLASLSNSAVARLISASVSDNADFS